MPAICVFDGIGAETKFEQRRKQQLLNEYNADTSNLFKRHQRKLILRPLLAVLSILVVFATAYMLILPGITLEKATVCGQLEHVHNAGCYTPVLVCGIEESELHTHSEACYEKELTCGLEEHTHQDSCYASSAAPLTEEPSITPAGESEESPSVEPTVTAAVTPTVTPTPEPTTQPSVTPAAEYRFENDAISVKAVLSENAVIPADAQLQVMDITQESDSERYSAFQKLLLPLIDNTAADTSSDPGMLAYDIGFFVDGVEVEPTGGSVQVTIDYKAPLMNAVTNEGINLYHVVETAAAVELEVVQGIEPVVSAEGSVQSITFDTNSFSAFLVTNGYTMSHSLDYLLVDQLSETFINTSYYNAANPLGIAGNFHIVAFDTATLNSHTNGNVLAKNLYANSNFGTKNYGPELSYIQNYMAINGSSAADAADVLAVGSSKIVSLVDNGNAFAISGTKIDLPKNIWQDSDSALIPFVDLAAVETQIKGIASVLAGQPNSNITATTADRNNTSLTLSSTAPLGVYNLTADELVNSYPNSVNVRGFTTGSDDTVIINIDCAGKTAVSVPIIRMWMEGAADFVPTAEITTFQSGKIILNFVNSANVTITLKQTYATVIAPDANIIVGTNLNGTIIGNNVTINAESHRTDFTGTLPVKIIVTKSWYAANGTTQLTGASIADLAVSVQLYCDNTAMTGAAYKVTLNAANSWTYTWSGLNIGSGQKYSVKEVSISKAGTVIQTGEPGSPYAVTYTNNAGILDGAIAIKNAVASGNIQVIKTWRANDGTVLTGASISGLSASVQLYCNNVAMVGTAYTVTLNAANNWSYTWSGLDIGSSQKYTVKETEIGGYTITYANNSGIQNGVISVNNTRGQPFVLPATGGGGTNILYAVGTVMLLSVFLLTGMKIRYRKRKGGQSSA